MNHRVPVPADIKLMNLSTVVLGLGLGCMVLAALLGWVVRLPAFALQGITVYGDVAHNNAVTLRTHVAPQLHGNFFTLNLDEARKAFESVPWVRVAMVQRDFPNRLTVRLQEHKVVAYWGSESDSTLLNVQGEIFEANVDDLEEDDLPRLDGPPERSNEVLAMYRVLVPEFEPLDVGIEVLALSARGSWRLELDSGGVVEIGQGRPDELVQRVRRFVHTVTQVTSRYGRKASSIESADLRHPEGYALRLRGVSTVAADARKK